MRTGRNQSRWDYDQRDGRMYDDRPRSRSPGGQAQTSFARGRGGRYQDNRQGYRDRDREGYHEDRQPSQYSHSPEYSRDSRDHRDGNRGSDYSRVYRDHDHSPDYSRDSRDYNRNSNRNSNYSRDYNRTSEYSHGAREHNRSTRQHPGTESREVVLEGVPLDMTDNHVKTELRNEYNVPGLEKVRLIRDRESQISRGVAFLKFESLEDSKQFIKDNFPAVYLFGPSGGENSTKVTIAYSRERDSNILGQNAYDWFCRMCSVRNLRHTKICSNCNAPKPAMLDKDKNGDTDVSTETHHVLIFRQLQAHVTEEMLATAAKKLIKKPASPKDPTAPIVSSTSGSKLGAKAGSILRVFLMRDRQTDASWGYGFVEFAEERDAQDAMAKLRTFEKFMVASHPILVNYIHSGVFVTVADPTTEHSKYSFSNLSSSRYFRYWDPQGYASEHVVEVVAESAQPAPNLTKPTGQQSNKPQGFVHTDKSKKRKAEPAANSNTISAPPQLAIWRDKYAELHGPQESADQTAPVTDNSTTEPSVNDLYLDYENLVCWLCKLDFEDDVDLKFHSWHDQDHQKLLHDDVALLNKIEYPTYVDPRPKTPICLLCRLKFASMVGLMQHVRCHEKHRNNCNDPEKLAGYEEALAAVNAVIARCAKKDLKDQNGNGTFTSEQAKAPISGAPAQNVASVAQPQPDPEYRDRAKERRLAFGQTEAKEQKAAASQVDDAPVKSTSKGASLLKKMGWVEGSGLGVDGTGRVDPIAQQVYAEGVGLGAKGGKIGDAVEEAGRKTRGLQHEFLDKTKESARQRYDDMAKKD